ncbi:uncharacterized protein DUF2442 [Rhodopseudomonas thermotolerans]|uniref:Uncharacterized protein DUF2442 n=2 Tax=Rhodopseudomonas TaxID=1073 RepID=A0A336JWB1_9BRAD|nr:MULTISPECIES: DUF2442 domain-containing protein [Rhodopseudomonas]RED28617.1 uncharacterized protein DUF2442 [Rhodopseudomonas pentothenatexigens]REF91536.1 uncharacterized protein DUF2442 [Rhodopseudomonas thermotolerans]SSW92559.1 uncharacterized protein DUF2442 [Rhodopseudomonas pentothenatexigens]
MTEILVMRHAEPVIFGVLKIVWADGFEGIVDLRPLINKGTMFAFLRASPPRFNDVVLEAHGHKIFWVDDDGDEIDFGSEALRHRAERQAGLLHLAS